MEAELRPEPGPRRLSKEELSSLIDTLHQQGLSKEQITDALRKSGLYTPEEPAQGLTLGKVPIEAGLVGIQPISGLTRDSRPIGKDMGESRPEWLQKIINEFALKSPDKPSPKESEASPVSLSVSTVRHRFLSFNPFDGVDTDLSPEEGARLFKETAALERLAGHFVQRADEIESLLNKAKAHPEKEQYYTREASVLSCATLQQVSEAPHLREGIRLLARARKHHLDVDAIASVITYIEEFFEQEERLLVELGVSGDRATGIIADCRKVFKDVRSGQAPRGRIFEAITRVTDATCDLAERLREQAIQERERERAKRILKTASKAIGGTAVVALNARILATPGLQAVAVFSGVLGAGLIEAAAQEL